VIIYTDDLTKVTADALAGFFKGWPNPPTPETHLDILRNSDEIVLAIDDESGRAVGYITAITDRVLSAYIPLLEVLPEHRRRGIGHELVRKMLAKLNGLYMIDTCCDPEMVPFYKSFGMEPANAMTIRNHQRQSGAERG